MYIKMDSRVDRHAAKQTGANRKEYRTAGGPTGIWTDGRSDRHVDRQADDQAGGRTDKWPDRRMDRQAVVQTGGPADGQTRGKTNMWADNVIELMSCGEHVGGEKSAGAKKKPL